MIESSRDNMSRLREAVYKYNAAHCSGASNFLVHTKWVLQSCNRLYMLTGTYSRKPFEEERNHTRWCGFELEPFYD